MQVPSSLPRWTVLIYTSATPDLQPAVRDSLQEICDGGAPDEVQVVAQMGEAGRAQRFRLQPGAPQPLSQAETADMASPQQLHDFLHWGMQAYPAQHYAVVLGGHGAGFAGAVTSTDRRKMLRLPELEQALGRLPARPELVIFNTCLGAQAEVAEQLAPVAANLVASQSRLTGLGLPLAPWTQQLSRCRDGASAGAALVACSTSVPERAPAVGWLDLSRWPRLSEQLDALAGQILEHPAHHPVLRRHLAAQEPLVEEQYGRPLTDQIDLVSLCQAWRDEADLPPALRESAGRLVEDLQDASSASQTGRHGLSIYAPERPMAEVGPIVAELYGQLRLARQTRWDEAIAALATGC